MRIRNEENRKLQTAPGTHCQAPNASKRQTAAKFSTTTITQTNFLKFQPNTADKRRRKTSIMSFNLILVLLLTFNTITFAHAVNEEKSSTPTTQSKNASSSSFYVISDANKNSSPLDALNTESSSPINSLDRSMPTDTSAVNTSSALAETKSPTPELINTRVFRDDPNNMDTDMVENGKINDPGKRRQYIPPGAAATFDPAFLGGPALAPALPSAPGPPVTCPSGGPPLPIECDPKRPWPQCPPQSYCYATNTVDIGPYFCCPIWSTYGAAWRPATPFYNYAPPPPPNWPETFRLADPRIGFPPRKSRKEPRNIAADRPPEVPLNDMPTEDQLKIHESVNGWVERQPLVEPLNSLAESSNPSQTNANNHNAPTNEMSPAIAEEISAIPPAALMV